MSPSVAQAALHALEAVHQSGSGGSQKQASGRMQDQIPAVSGDASDIALWDSDRWEPCGLVSGASVYHMGAVGWPFENAEVVAMSKSLLEARKQAIARLIEAAERLRADGVVNTTLDVQIANTAGRLSRFVALGTAIRGKKKSEPAAAESHRPFVTTMSMAEIRLLEGGGYRPVGLVMGSCVYHVWRRPLRDWAGGFRRNRELSDYSDARSSAREIAMTRLQHEAGQHGVTAVSIQERHLVWGTRALRREAKVPSQHRVIEFFALGEAMTRVAVDAAGSPPVMVVPLNDLHLAVDPRSIVSSGEGQRHV